MTEASATPHLLPEDEQRMKIVERLRTLVAERLRPPPQLTLSEWADRYRYLSAETTAESGTWRTDRVPFMRGPMDAFSDPEVRKVVVTKAAQVGYTEVLGNVVGYFIHQDPASILVIQPTVEMGQAWSKERLAPMLRDSPALQGKIADPKSRDSGNTIRDKSFPGGFLAIVGANAPAGLAARPIRVVLADEVDRWAASAGTEGDPLSLAEKRQTTFLHDSKTLIGSTPGLKGVSIVEREYEASDKRRYHVPCPGCGTHQVLEWRNVNWDRDEDGNHLPETATYRCTECGDHWDDATRWRAVSKGEWIAEKPLNGVAGFHISGLLSPWLPLEKLVREFLEAKAHPELLKSFINTRLGESWEERGERTDPGLLRDRVEPYDADNVPADVRIVTAGVDTQGDRLEVTFVGWGDGEEAWVLAHLLLPGEVGEPTLWNRDLDAALRRRFTTEDGRTLRVRVACIDTGGQFGNMDHAFCRRRRGRNIYATKGLPSTPRGSPPIWSATTLNSKNKADKLYGVGVDTAKDDLASRLRIKPIPGEPTPNAVHFPYEGLSADYFEQLTAEHAVTTKNKQGRPVRVWKKKPGQERNEALDCFILAYAALLSLPVRMPILQAQANPEPDPLDDALETSEPEDVVDGIVAAAPPRPRLTVAEKMARWAAAMNR